MKGHLGDIGFQLDGSLSGIGWISSDLTEMFEETFEDLLPEGRADFA